MKKLLLLTLLTFTTLINTACWETPEPNHVLVQAIYGEIKQVVRPPGIYTITTRGDSYAPVSTETKTTDDIVIRGSSKDNAGFQVLVKLTFTMPNNDANILPHVKKFGFDVEARNAQMLKTVVLELQSQIGNAANNYAAYDLVEKSTEVQSVVLGNMREFFKTQVHMYLDNLQLVGKPDFDNDGIDVAASNVVKAQKDREAAEAELATAKVQAERKAVESQTYAKSPQLLELEVLDRKRAIAEALATNQGTLVLGGEQLKFLLGNK